MPNSTINGWVSKNLLQIVCGTAVVYAGYQVGKVEQTARAEKNADAIERIEKRVSQRLKFMNDTRNRVELLCEDSKRCKDRFPPMEIPE